MKNLKLPVIYDSGVITDAEGNTLIRANRTPETTPLQPHERDELLKLVADLLNDHFSRSKPV